MDCKNHPGIPAKRKCYLCSKPVCSVCQTRGDHHIFCSEQCLVEHNKSQKTPSKAETGKDQGRPLVPGTPEVDAAYFGEQAPINIKGINLETFEAIQSIIDRTDSDIRAYLKDLELIFETANSQSIGDLKGYFDDRWGELSKSIGSFSKQAEDSAAKVAHRAEDLAKGNADVADQVKKLRSFIETSSHSLDGRMEKATVDIGQEFTKRFAKLTDSLERFSFSVDESVAALKELSSQGAERISADISRSGAKTSSDLSEGLKGLRSHLDSRMGELGTVIESSRAQEKELFEKNESGLRGLLEGERKSIDELIAEHSKKLAANLSTNKERIALALKEGNSEVKDFLDYQRSELTKSVLRVSDSLSQALKSGEKGISETGTTLTLKLSSALEETADWFDESLGSFEKGLEKRLADQTSGISSFVREVEDEERALLAGLEKKLDEMLELHSAKSGRDLEGLKSSVEKLLEGNREAVEGSIRSHGQHLDATLSESSENARSGLEAVSQNILEELDRRSSDIKDALSSSSVKVEGAFKDNSKSIGEFLDTSRQKISVFMEDSFESEKAEIRKLFEETGSKITAALDKAASQLDQSGKANREEIAGTVGSSFEKIDALIKNHSSNLESRLTSTAKNIEVTSIAAMNNLSQKISAMLDSFQSKANAHIEKKEKILIDQLAALAAAGKGNLEEVLNRNRVDLDAQIKKVEGEASKLIKAEIGKSMDTFNLNLSSLLGDIKENLKKKVQAIPTQFTLSPLMKGAIIALITLALLSPALVFVITRNSARQLGDRIAGISTDIGKGPKESAPAVTPPAKEEAKAPVDLAEKPSIFLRDSIVTTRNRISLKGESKFGDFALLAVNGQWRSVRFISKSRFSFEDIELAPGKNTIEVTTFSITGGRSRSEAKEVMYTKASSSMKSFNLAYNIARGDVRRPTVSLTFDGGSNPEAAPSILDTLKAKGIRTTMFLTGKFIKDNPELVRRIAADGHEVGNHTYSHPHIISADGRYQSTAISRKDFEAEMRKTAAIFKEITGKDMAPFWRAPYGQINDDVLAWAKGLGYTHVRWTTKEGKAMDTLDWVEAEESKLYRTAEEIKKAVLDFDDGNPGGSNGSIIIMHLGTNRSSDQPYSKLGEIIDGMRGKGYQFVKVSELLQSYNLKRVATNK